MVTPPVSLQEGADVLGPEYSFLKDVSWRLWHSPSARIGGFIVVIFITLAVLIPLIDHYDALRDLNLPARYHEPDCIIGWLSGDFSLSEMTCTFPFGADKSGRDITRRVGHGMSVSLMAGVFVVVISLSVGSVIGLAAGYFSGYIDTVSMRAMDVLLAFPALLLAIVIVTIFGRGLRNGMLAVAITQIPVYARLARSMAISIRNTEFVTAARSVGASHWAIIRRHIFPNSLAPLLVQATLGLGTAVVETAALGFLGLGQQPPRPELGKMLAESQQSLSSGKWWVMLFPGVTIVLMVLGFNLLGDGLRDALDPRLRGTQ